MSRVELTIVSPRESESYQKLIKLASQAGIDVGILKDLLWRITAHSQLVALPLAASRLLQILDIAPETWKEIITESGIDQWRPVLNWLIKEKHYLASEIGEHYGREANTAGNNPVMGSGATEFPIYNCLTEKSPAPPNDKRHVLLVGHLVIANAVALQEETVLSDYEDNGAELNWVLLGNRPHSAALAVRRLCSSKFVDRLQALPLILAPDEFAEVLDNDHDDPVQIINTDLESLTRFLRKCWGQLEWVDRAGGGGGGGDSEGHKWVGNRREVGNRITIETYPGGDEEDPSSNWGKIEIVTTRPLSSRKSKSRLRSDLPPDEDEDEEDIILSDFDCGTTKMDLGAQARAARAKARHIAKANQLVPWSYSGLAVEELAQLLAKVSETLRVLLRDKVRTNEQEQTLETLLLIHVMLWTGSSVERAAGIKICNENSVDEKIQLGLVFPPGKSIEWVRWRIKALEPDYKTNLEGTSTQLRNRVKAIDYPDLIGIAPFIRSLLENRTALKKGMPVFNSSTQELKRHLKQWLENYSPDGRVTTTKLADTLWQGIQQDVGDPTLASCVTGEMHHLAQVRIFYTTPSIARLRGLYEATVRKLAGQTYAALSKPIHSPSRGTLSDSGEGSVGARLCPQFTAVKALFDRLREDINACSSYVDRAGFIQYHNLLTLFCVQHFAYATTCRAIITPYLPLSAIDPKRGLASLSDKDDTFKHKTRLVWIPEALRETMARYDEHLRTVKAQLTTSKGSVLAEACFFLDESQQPLHVRPKTIEARLGDYLNVRANTHRRFLRTELIERGCPPEVLDALMGHWQQGEEPFGFYSSFSFARYVEQLRTYLNPLLAELGLDRPLLFKWC